MNSFCFGILLTFGLFMLLPTPAKAFIARSTGCHHNGTWYADKSLVPTVEKCLNCQCNKKTLVCRLKVCPEMPMPPPRGCVIVQKKHTCCPYLSCARLEAFYKIPITRRIIAYLDHYERESIDRVVNENMLQRRSDDSEVDLMVCVKNGTVYKSGSAMSSSNLCSYCYCIGGTEKCVKPKCMLPVEGCKPIFVDSTCCPVRYDCSVKTSGKSSQEVRYRKTANKHFQRMSQRLQRNRGCTVSKQFYAEGQKMKSDPDKPCDICFCIRGTRRCAPKKCSPALKNCIPVVPKGQCCPSSYDCGSQRDYRRSHNSRQFNLFSLLFGKDDVGVPSSTATPEHYPHDRDPALAANKYKTHEQALQASSEKSILDTLREGLEYIDGNTKQMLEANQDLLTLQAKRETVNEMQVMSSTLAPTTIPSPPTPPTTTETIPTVNTSTTEISFLDLLLGEAVDLPTEQNYAAETTPNSLAATENQDELSWVDILLGPDKRENNTHFASVLESTTKGLSPELITSIDRLDDDFDSDLGTSGEIFVNSDEDVKTLSMLNAAKQRSTTTTTAKSATNSIESTTESLKVLDTKIETSKPFKKQQHQTAIKPIPVHSSEIGNQQLTDAMVNHTSSLTTTTKAPLATTKPLKQTNILAAFLDGITDILNAENSLNITSTTTTTVRPLLVTKSTLKPINKLPMFRPLPTQKQHTRINSKIANLTASTPKIVIVRKPTETITFKKLPTVATAKPSASKETTTTSRPTKTTITSTTNIPTTTSTTSSTTTSTTSTTTTTTKKPRPSTTTVTTVKPLIIKTNPTILEAEPLDDEGSTPTLPPSLPNLKIIPFLPTDAVEAASTTNFDFAPQAPKPNYESFDDAKLYPAITESSYVSYAVDMEDDNKAKYIYKFKVEGPAEVDTAPKAPIDESFLKYEFVEKNGFSPPTKTEGGFMPKEPLPIDDDIIVDGEFNVSKLNEIYPATMHIIDITTAEPMTDNLTKIIEITTPDPFKDVIHTEPPPDLTAIIQDKLDIEHIKVNSTYSMPPERSAPRPFSVPTTTSTELPTSEDKNSIETLLDILFKEEHNEQNPSVHFKTNTMSSTIPPFKNLPQTTMSLFTTSKPMTKSTTPTSSSLSSTTSTSTSTKRPQRTKTTPISVGKNKTKSNATIATTRRPQATSTPSSAKPTKLKNNNNNNNSATRKTTTPKSTPAQRKASISTAPSSSLASSTVAVEAAAAAAKSTTPSILHPKLTITTTVSPIYAEKTTKSALAQQPTTTTTTTTHNPFLMSPFDKLPFMDASFEIKRHQTTTIASGSTMMPSSSSPRPLTRLDGLDAAYEISNAIIGSKPTVLSMSTTATRATTSHSTPLASSISDKQHSTTSPSHSLIDPTGILKLAGCNIYGRMYRVGRIILELSSPCVECKCTETGVKCGQLDC